jgi:hypothetical protein
MYWPKPGIKRDPLKRWNQPDRVFFGHGACHILAGVFLDLAPLNGFFAERIIPHEGFSGNHIYVTDGSVAFDFHGYSVRDRLVQHHRRGWSDRYPGWDAAIMEVDFPLLDTAELNCRKHLGPDQYFDDPVARARSFLQRVDHKNAYEKARRIIRVE